MEVKVKYSGLEERQAKVTENEAMGLRMLHDSFDNPNWKHGDPIIGTMTFTNVIPPVVIPEPVRDLAAEIDVLKAKIIELESIKTISM